jgi:hypothetical protein
LQKVADVLSQSLPGMGAGDDEWTLLEVKTAADLRQFIYHTTAYRYDAG